MATAAAVALLARCPLGPFASRAGCLRVALRPAVMALAVAILMRPAFVGTATGPPDFDQHRLGGRLGLGFDICSSFDSGS
ncbi:hypothetical protein, partial [Klebsiella pneumoniae]|uniref:hypothetical protein n=1 Tax=Klebsiella pneumoniae TaxID=573 RepID=UPI003B982696